MNTPPPRRLVDESGELSELMRVAARQYSRGLDVNRAFQRQLERQRRPVLGRLLPASLVFAAAAAALVMSVRLSQRTDSIVALPEPMLAKPVESLEPEQALPAVEELATRKTPKAERTVVPPVREPRGSAAVPESVSDKPEPNTTKTPEASVDCLGFARTGDAKRAATCFEAQAVGTGLSAEVALYELARLRRDALGDANGALAALDNYNRQFPNGSLSGEVRFSRVELLSRLGRADEALSASDALLSSRFGSERAAEIRLLRGNVYLRSLADPVRAAREYEFAAKGSGRVADEAAFLLGVSLEKAGDIAGARAVFERYVERPGARHRSEAAEKLKSLAPE